MTHQQNSQVRRDERYWQDHFGGTLQEQSYQRPGIRVVIHHQLARIAKALELKSGMRLLDLGCGVGRLLGWLARQTHAKYHGIDLSLNSARKARQENLPLEISVGDAEFLPYKDESFDRISCNGAAHHLLRLRPAVHEIYRVLAPGGIVVMYEPATTALTNVVRWLLVRNDKYESPADLAHKSEFTRKNVKGLLVEVGFVGVMTSSCDYLAYPLSGMYMDLPLGWSQSAMEFLIKLESGLERWSVLKPIFDVFAWCWLIVATKPGEKVLA